MGINTGDEMKNKTDELFTATVNHALEYVEYLAREAFRKDKRLKDCVIAMGSYTFATKQGIIDDNDIEKYPAIKPFFDYMDEWDEYLHLSGAGRWFKSDGTTLTKW